MSPRALIFGGHLDATGGLWRDGELVAFMKSRRVGEPDLRSDVRRRLEAAVEQAIAALDALDGDPDLEVTCEDEGAQCEGEGDHDEREPQDYHCCCHFDLDQRNLSRQYT